MACNASTATTATNGRGFLFDRGVCYTAEMRFSVRYILMCVMPYVAIVAWVNSLDHDRLSARARILVTLLFLVIWASVFVVPELRALRGPKRRVNDE